VPSRNSRLPPSTHAWTTCSSSSRCSRVDAGLEALLMTCNQAALAPWTTTPVCWIRARKNAQANCMAGKHIISPPTAFSSMALESRTQGQATRPQSCNPAGLSRASPMKGGFRWRCGSSLSLTTCPLKIISSLRLVTST